MYNTNYSDCSQYLDSAEWLRITDILNDWCKLDQSCKKIKELAILGACERDEIEYIRNDGKDFNDSVIELYGRGILLINKQSFNQWKIKFEKKDQKINQVINKKNKPANSFLDVLNHVDDDYISIEDVLDAIHKNIGTNLDISKAVRILNTAIGGAFTPPTIYKNDDFKGWTPIILKNEYTGDFLEVTNSRDQAKLEVIHYLVKKIIEQKKSKELDDELPF